MSDMSGVQNALNSVLGSVVSMNATLGPLATNVEMIVKLLTDIKVMLVHWHNMHLHARAHKCEDGYQDIFGHALLPTPITPAEKLIQEYNTGYDIDYNGIIYGKDFKLKDTDDVPRMLKHVNSMLDPEKYSEMSFQEYLTSVPNYAKVWYL